jgi:hypothetical protein
MNLHLGRGQPCPREPNRLTSRTWLSALLRQEGSWSQCMRKIERRLSMNRRSGVQIFSISNLQSAITLQPPR